MHCFTLASSLFSHVFGALLAFVPSLLLGLVYSCALLLSHLTLLTLTPCCYRALPIFALCCFHILLAHALLAHTLLLSRLTTPRLTLLPCYFALLRCFHTLLLHALLCCSHAMLLFVITPCCCCALLHATLAFMPCCPIIDALPLHITTLLSHLDARHFQVPPTPPQLLGDWFVVPFLALLF
jgi:hypothetical protein